MGLRLQNNRIKTACRKHAQEAAGMKTKSSNYTSHIAKQKTAPQKLTKCIYGSQDIPWPYIAAVLLANNTTPQKEDNRE